MPSAAALCAPKVASTVGAERFRRLATADGVALPKKFRAQPLCRTPQPSSPTDS